jgi:glycosyltransferase involved in cell wall biosynthesis
MRLIIDMQGAQSTGSRNRGIGRYTLALTQEIARQRGDREVILALNGTFADTIEPLRAAFADLLPADAIRVWHPPMPCSALDVANDARRSAAEAIYETFLASLTPDVVLVTSLFEGLGDDVVTSVGRMGRAVPTVVVLYDLIPLIHSDVYLTNPDVDRWYQRKVDHLRRADLLLSISASSGREAVDHLDFPVDCVVNISTACNAEFKPEPVTDATRESLSRRYGLVRPYLMYTGGIDYRKNIEGLIRAYSLLAASIRAKHQLAIVCSMQDADRQRLAAICSDCGLAEHEVVMTGFVPENDLVALYNDCALFVFPSWHEGFGLPALEAMACGRPTIGANTSSLPEVIGWDEAMFDPRDDKAIASSMTKALTDAKFRRALMRHAGQQAKAFSWERSARTAWAAIAGLRPERAEAARQVPGHPRPRMAFFSPLPSARSGIADYSAELLPQLALHYEIDIILAQDEPLEDTWVTANAPVRDIAWFRSNHHRFDRILYQFGNSHFHSHMFDLIEEFPGVVILHDFYLSGIVRHLEYSGMANGLWTRALLIDHGWPAVAKRFGADDNANVAWAYPCNGSVLRGALAIIAHSRHGIELARHWHGTAAATAWQHVPLPRSASVILMDASAGNTRLQSRAALGVRPDDILICAFGHMGPTKLNDRLLDAWLKSPMAAQTNCRLVFVGQNEGGPYGASMERQIAGSGGRVQITGFVDQQAYRQWLDAADIAVQLRTNSRGETSAAVLDCWNAGLATIVNAHGALAELPDDCVVKLPDDFTDPQLVDALTKLHKSAAYRQAVGEKGRARLLAHHDPRNCAEAYAAIIEAAYADADRRVHGLLKQLPHLAPNLTESDLVSVAQSISVSMPPQPRRRQWLIDCTHLVGQSQKMHEESVGVAFLHHLMLNSPDGIHVEPIRFDIGRGIYVKARVFGCAVLGIPNEWAEDEVLEAWQGDVIIQLATPRHDLKSAIEQQKLHGLNIVPLEASLRRIKNPNADRFDRLVGLLVAD